MILIQWTKLNCNSWTLLGKYEENSINMPNLPWNYTLGTSINEIRFSFVEIFVINEMRQNVSRFVDDRKRNMKTWNHNPHRNRKQIPLHFCYNFDNTSNQIEWVFRFYFFFLVLCLHIKWFSRTNDNTRVWETDVGKKIERRKMNWRDTRIERCWTNIWAVGDETTKRVGIIQ